MATITLTLKLNPQNNLLYLSTNQFTIGNQYDNNTIQFKLDRQDPYSQYIPYIVIHPINSKPFSPILFTTPLTLTNLFTQQNEMEVQVQLKQNYDVLYSNIVRLHLRYSDYSNAAIDLEGIYNKPVCVVRDSHIITHEELAPFLPPEPESPDSPNIPFPPRVDPDETFEDNTPAVLSDTPDIEGSDSENTDSVIPAGITLTTPPYFPKSNSLLIFKNGTLLSPSDYQEDTNSNLATSVLLYPDSLNENDKIEFVVFK